jgi:hypothetical protein
MRQAVFLSKSSKFIHIRRVDREFVVVHGDCQPGSHGHSELDRLGTCKIAFQRQAMPQIVATVDRHESQIDPVVGHTPNLTFIRDRVAGME